MADAPDSTDAWLSRDPLPEDPLPLLADWLREAFAAGLQPNPHAIALATVDADGAPAVRMVLCQAIETSPGALLFYTNTGSAKGEQLRARPHAAAVFHFGPQGRQARVAGPVSPVSNADADAYFASRPVDAQVGAWASAQSRPLASRDALLEEMDRIAERFGVDWHGDRPSPRVPRPPHWGGYRLHAERVELWHSRPGRIHDRATWSRAGGAWKVQRLAP